MDPLTCTWLFFIPTPSRHSLLPPLPHATHLFSLVHGAGNLPRAPLVQAPLLPLDPWRWDPSFQRPCSSSALCLSSAGPSTFQRAATTHGPALPTTTTHQCPCLLPRTAPPLAPFRRAQGVQHNACEGDVLLQHCRRSLGV